MIVFKNEKSFTTAQLKYNEEALFTAYKQYDQEVIIAALQKFFEGSTWNKRVSDFLKSEPLNMQKVAFIENTLLMKGNTFKALSMGFHQLIINGEKIIAQTRRAILLLPCR